MRIWAWTPWARRRARHALAVAELEQMRERRAARQRIIQAANTSSRYGERGARGSRS